MGKFGIIVNIVIKIKNYYNNNYRHAYIHTLILECNDYLSDVVEYIRSDVSFPP